MADPITICNQALGWLGASLINSLTESSTEAQLCLANYEELRDAVTQEGRWTFARNSYELSTNRIPAQGSVLNQRQDDFAFERRTQIPSRVLQILRVYDPNTVRDTQRRKKSQVLWQIQGNYLLCDEPVIYIDTIDQQTNEEHMPPVFRQALAYRIATELAIPLTNDRNLAELYELKYQKRLADALAIDGIQGRNEAVVDGSFITVRGSRGLIRG
jgi:hypothetical protein